MSTLNEEAWKVAQVLRVGSTLFDIDYNPPTVEKVSASFTLSVWEAR